MPIFQAWKFESSRPHQNKNPGKGFLFWYVMCGTRTSVGVAVRAILTKTRRSLLRALEERI